MHEIESDLAAIEDYLRGANFVPKMKEEKFI
jgi:hypothetical protein